MCILLEEVERSAEDDPFHAVLVAFTQRLPHRLLLGCLASNGDPGASATLTGRVLLDFSKFDTLGWDVMPSICKVEHAPKGSVGVGL